MFKRFVRIMLPAMCVAFVFSANANAAFAKTATYTAGQFTDVSEAEWYGESVKDAYEYGIMNGDSSTTFSPNGTLTVAEGVTIASRIHAALGGETVLPAEGEWYMPYVNYAVSHGFMKENTFDSYDRNITRYEIAELLSDVCGDLPEINDISGVYDVPSEKILKLYKTGILTGNDEYGTFDGDANLKRSEISAMAVRIADSTKRVRKVLVQRPAVNYGDAYGIIENIRGYGPNDIANGWNYDNRFDFFNETGKGTMMKLDDTKTSAYQRLIRDFKPESEGLLKFEFNGTVTSSDDGAYLAFLNEQEERLLWLSVKEGYWYIHGLDTVSTGVPAGACNIEMSIDLDAGVAKTVINSVECPDVSFRKGTFTRLVAGTTKEGTGYIHAFHTMLSKNYVLLEHFLTGANGVGKTPVGWYIDGDFTIQKNLGMLEPDLYSVKSETKAGDTSVAYTYFTPVSGLFTFQTAILLPEKVSGAKVSLLSGGREVLTIETKPDGMYIGEKMLNNYFGNVWQTLLVDGDTETGKATVRINGKNKGEFDFSASSFDGVKITFAPDKDAVMWFDDVTVNNRHEYADYPSYPKVAKSDGYNIGINVCWLWRDQHSGEGWDAVSAFPEFDTYLGFYDEGIRETADWEIKLMAEHGIDFMHVCWYAPYANTTEPIKQMRHSYAALHDGYFNAEYSDLVDFCIMWENNSVDVKNLEDFKEYIWKYWVEYYFKDERYVRLDNKALLTVWSATNFSKAFGGDAGAAKAVAFMNEDIKNYGYDGIIVITNAGPGENTQGKYTWLNGMGLDGTYIYATTELDGEKQFAINKNNMTYAEKCGMFHLPTIGVGFNDVGRNERRSAIISEQQHLLVCQRVKAALDAKKTGTFLDNTLMISTWNEWSEGHYVMPSASNGFSYLENIRKTFTKDTSDHTAVDAPLTETQLARICRTYPENHSPVRWFQNEASDIPEDFGDKYPGVKVNGTELNFTFLPVKTADGDLEVVGEDRNNGFYSMLRVYHEWNRFDGELTIITRDEKTLTFTVGTNIVYVDGKPTDAGFTFKLRDGLPVFHIKKLCDLLGYPYTQDGEKVLVQAATDHEYKVLSSRVDYQWEFNLEGELEGWRAQGTKNLTVGSDGYLTGISVGKDPAIMKTVSLYSGDFSHVRIGVVYEEGLYDDSKPQLFYTTKSSGSYSADKCLNGIYVIPENTKNGDVIEAVFEFPENADLEITSLRFDMFGSANEYKIDYIRVTMEREKAPEPVYIEPNDANRWNFDTNGDAQGWESPLPLTVQGGYLSATPVNPDPYILRKVNFKYNDYHVMIVGVKNTGSLRNKVGYLYFTTDKDGSLSADKMITAKYRVPSGTEVGDTVEIVFDLSSNPKFNDTITTVRFDPFNDLPAFSIDYIKFCRIEGQPSFVHEQSSNAQLQEEGTEQSVIEDRDPIVFKNSYEVPEKAPQWYFDSDDKEGWQSNLDLKAENGTITAPKNGHADPYILHGVNFAADDYDMLVVGVKYSDLLKRTTGYLYFATDTEGSISADKMISATYRCPKNAQPGDTVEIIFYLHEHKKFTGTIKQIRVDPYNDYPSFSVDYILLANGAADSGAETEKTYTVHKGSYTEIYDSNHNEFDIDGYDEGWKSARNITVEDGYLKLAGGSADPYIVKNVSFAADKYEVIVCGVKYSEHLKNKTGYLYFGTSASSALGEDKKITAKYNIPENVKEGDTVEIIFQLGFHPMFTGTIKQIRFDPYNDIPACDIDYIRCCTNYSAEL